MNLIEKSNRFFTLPFYFLLLLYAILSNKINERFYSPEMSENPERQAVGAGASFVCGRSLRFYLRIDLNKGIIEAKYKTTAAVFSSPRLKLRGKIRRK